MSTLKAKIAALALEIINEPIMLRERSRNGPVACWEATVMGKDFVGRDDAVYDSYGSGARPEASRKATGYKAEVIAERVLDLLASEVLVELAEEDGETRI